MITPRLSFVHYILQAMGMHLSVFPTNLSQDDLNLRAIAYYQIIES